MEQLRLTTLKAARGLKIRKTVALLSDGSIKTLAGYPRIPTWTRQVHTLDHDIDALAAFLTELSTDPTACLVTGEPCGSIPLAAPARRRKNAEPGIPATLAECAAPWLPIDLDGIPITGRLDPLDPEPAIAEVVAMLGEPFASASYGWQLTAQAAPFADQLRLRLYFLLDRAITNEDRRRWALGLNAHVGIKLTDPAIYSAAQPIYTAAPLFAHGKDPFPGRCGVVYGEEELLRWGSVPIHETHAQGAYAGSEWAGRTPRGITELLESIGDHPGGLGFHEQIRDAVWRMVADRWTEDRIIGTIRATIGSANQSRHKRSEIERYVSLRYLRESIKGADRRIKIAANAPRATQTLRHSAPIPLEQAQRQIRDAVWRWLRGEGPAKLVLATTVGSGKSTLAADVIREEPPDDRTLLWAFPTHAQGEEILAKLNANGDPLAPLAVRIEGRVREDAELPKCHRPHLVEAVKAAGLARHTKSIACQRDGEKCPHLADCAYYRQFRTGERVRLVPHALLPLE
ncbi:MAG: hypothetical protein FJ189_00865, partial [Gammaproteobacteria bacterium]|nr:hypothetical protein [Gammaproteobacteria bacterium]